MADVDLMLVSDDEDPRMILEDSSGNRSALSLGAPFEVLTLNSGHPDRPDAGDMIRVDEANLEQV